MYDGKHVLIVFDDLSKQAEAYRAVSLLLRRPPGREAYPGDVFYLHSRLLERCAKLSDELGGGSMTGLPIIETKANDVSAYIPTNVISITDGQIFLESDLFNAGQSPGRQRRHLGLPGRWRRAGQGDARRSPARCGSTWRSTASSRRSPPSPPTSTRPPRRSSPAAPRLVELLKQPQYSPYPVEEQVVSIWAGTDRQARRGPGRGRPPLRERVARLPRHEHTDVLATHRETNKLDDDTEAALESAVDRVQAGLPGKERRGADRPGRRPEALQGEAARER